MPFVIRSYQSEDFDRVLEIAIAAFTPVYDSFLEMLGPEIFELSHSGWHEKYRKYITSVAAPDSGKRFFVALDDDTIVGFVEYWTTPEKQSGEIGLNGVDPAHQGKGIGRAMHEFVLEEMKKEGLKLAVVSTGADPSHASARASYEKAGFTRHIPMMTLYKRLS